MLALRSSGLSFLPHTRTRALIDAKHKCCVFHMHCSGQAALVGPAYSVGQSSIGPSSVGPSTVGPRNVGQVVLAKSCWQVTAALVEEVLAQVVLAQGVLAPKQCWQVTAANLLLVDGEARLLEGQPEHGSIFNLFGACRRRVPSARSNPRAASETSWRDASFRYPQIDTGPRRSPSACAEILKKKPALGRL